MFPSLIQNCRVLVTGGAGFIGSNLCEALLHQQNEVVCLDDLSTGRIKNIESLRSNTAFTFIEGDIRDVETCRKAVQGVDYVLHQAALGSVPRSINDPITTNSVNINGFLNMLLVSAEAGVKRFIYAASSSTYGDSTELPKVEHRIGRPLSPYAVTKYVNEKYAQVFSDLYNLETIGLRYFNVFGKNQSPDGAYAAVIPLWVKQLLQQQSPVINGDGSFSRDFTYIDNVIQANQLAAVTPADEIRERALKNNIPLNDTKKISEIFNVAYGGNTTLNDLFFALRDQLASFNPAIKNTLPIYGAVREGDIPHSLASVYKAKLLLDYHPGYSATEGFERACEWYFNQFEK